MTTQIMIHGGQVMHPDGSWPVGWLLIEDGRIVHMDEGRPPNLANIERIEATGCAVLPGFIDLHVHGAVGCEAMDADPESLRKMAQFYAQHGTTAFLPTTWTESREKITAAVEAIVPLVDQPTAGATILGAHLEGPYISEAKPGAQDPRHVRRANREEAIAWMDTGIVRLIALAPEFAENHWLIEEAASRGIIVSAAHTEATPEDIAGAVELGLRQATHTFNAMTGLHHRRPGTVGAVLTQDAIYCELIADNIHVHPMVMDLIIRAKGLDKVLLITDAILAAGLPDGEHPLVDRVVTVKEGQVRLPDGTLAGSTLTMDAALRNIMAAAGLSLSEAWPLTSLNAATQMGITDRKGSLAVGHDADLVFLDEALQVRLTMVNGKVVYQAG